MGLNDSIQLLAAGGESFGEQHVRHFERAGSPPQAGEREMASSERGPRWGPRSGAANRMRARTRSD